jgi:hypothetical protein
VLHRGEGPAMMKQDAQIFQVLLSGASALISSGYKPLLYPDTYRIRMKKTNFHFHSNRLLHFSLDNVWLVV